MPRKPHYWEVWQGSTLICSAQMRLTREQAMEKVENEKRHGVRMQAKQAVCICDRPYNDYVNDNPYCKYPHRPK